MDAATLKPALVLVVLAAGCGPAVESEGASDENTTTTGASSDTSTTTPSASATTSLPTAPTTSPAPPTTADPSTGGTTTVGADSSSGAEVTAGGFIFDPDGGWCLRTPDGTLAHCSECDVWWQDCPQGEKCIAWGNDGTGVWNATYCGAVPPEPDAPGEPCLAENSGASGIDSCQVGAMCWNVDSETLEGVCVALCSGPEAAPVCNDPTTSCMFTNEGVLNLCLPNCDPLQQDCADGQGCYPFDDNFVCVREGDPVEADGLVHPSCPAGSLAVDADMDPTCEDAFCCTTYCDLQEPSCPKSQTCQPYFKEGNGFPPPIGYCAGPL